MYIYTHMYIYTRSYVKCTLWKSTPCAQQQSAEGKILPLTYFAIKVSQTSKPAGYNPVFTSCARMLSIKKRIPLLRCRRGKFTTPAKWGEHEKKLKVARWNTQGTEDIAVRSHWWHLRHYWNKLWGPRFQILSENQLLWCCNILTLSQGADLVQFQGENCCLQNKTSLFPETVLVTVFQNKSVPVMNNMTANNWKKCINCILCSGDFLFSWIMSINQISKPKRQTHALMVKYELKKKGGGENLPELGFLAGI